MATLIPDETGSLCPQCLTPLLVEEESGQRVCPQGDYHEGVDAREPLPPLAEQEKTIVADERIRAARARLGDLSAGHETPAQTVARLKANDPGWLEEWEQSPDAKRALPGEQHAHPSRAAAEQQARQANVTRASAQLPHERSSDAPPDKDAPRAAPPEPPPSKATGKS